MRPRSSRTPSSSFASIWRHTRWPSKDPLTGHDERLKRDRTGQGGVADPYLRRTRRHPCSGLRRCLLPVNAHWAMRKFLDATDVGLALRLNVRLTRPLTSRPGESSHQHACGSGDGRHLRRGSHRGELGVGGHPTEVPQTGHRQEQHDACQDERGDRSHEGDLPESPEGVRLEQQPP